MSDSQPSASNSSWTVNITGTKTMKDGPLTKRMQILRTRTFSPHQGFKDQSVSIFCDDSDRASRYECKKTLAQLQ